MDEINDDEASTLPIEPIPAYLILKDGPLKDEARRAHLLPFIIDAEGVLLKNWDEEAAKIERFLKTGEINGKHKRGAHLEIAK